MKIVAMTRAHIDVLMPYERELFDTEAWSPNTYRDELADTDHRRYVVVESDGGELLGWAGLLVIAETAQILTVGVIPAAQRQGLARLMLAEFYDEAIARGATELLLEVRVDNASARALYEREGFGEIGQRRGYYCNGRVDAVVMRRSLRAASGHEAYRSEEGS